MRLVRGLTRTYLDYTQDPPQNISVGCGIIGTGINHNENTAPSYCLEDVVPCGRLVERQYSTLFRIKLIRMFCI